MAQSSEAGQTKNKRTKMRKLPKNARVEKRPLIRPPIPSKNASSNSPKVVYISQRTPFVAAVKRVRKLLALADKRVVQSKSAHIAKDDPKRIEKLARATAGDQGVQQHEEVWVKATGRSLQRALQLAVYFQGQEDLKVRMRTGSVWAVDDIVLDETEGEDEQGDGGIGEHANVPETRTRQTSLLEVAVSLR